MDPIPLPPPFKGVNQQIPIQVLDSPFAEKLLNFNPSLGALTLRPGDSQYLSKTTVNYTPVRMFADGNTSLYAVAYNPSTNQMDFIDATTGSVLSSSAASGLDTFQIGFFNKAVYFYGYSTYTPGYYVNASGVWAAIGYTASTGTFTPLGSTGYKNRNYIIQKAAAKYWYSGIDQITGTVIPVDLSSILNEYGDLYIIAKVTLADSVEAVELLTLVFSTGEVLFYSGSYPNSADWQIVGRGTIGRPLWYGTGMQYGGDYLVFCNNGPTSLRDLFLQGERQIDDVSFGGEVSTAWELGFKGIPAAALNMRGAWDRLNNRIVIFSVAAALDGAAATGCFFFIYNTQLKSWYFHTSTIDTAAQDMVVFQNKVLLLADTNSGFMIVEKEGSTNYSDVNINGGAEQGYAYEIKSAAIKEGRAFVQKGEGLDLIVNSDLHGQTTYNLIRDFGVETTSNQIATGIVSGSLQKPFVNIGVEGTYIQYKISGTTTTGKTVGYRLYAINFWETMGDSPR